MFERLWYMAGMMGKITPANKLSYQFRMEGGKEEVLSVPCVRVNIFWLSH